MNRIEIKMLLRNWDVGDLISLKQARRGVVNTNWVVKTTKGRHVLRTTEKTK